MSYFATFLNIGVIVFLLGCSPTLPIANAGATGILAAQSPTATTSGQVLPVSARARIADRPLAEPSKRIELEVAKTPEQQAMGLMYRTSLPDDRGMLFEFKPARQVNFWMKNCQISLDMIFLRDGVVEAIAAETPPCTADPCPTYGPNTAVDRVIELRGGRAAELGVKVGDRIEIEFFQ
ncbi:DUF192 domain-containing protein [Microcoleus sp. N9_B2]|uniref:DUF192 domain-containing protein n=1 Tax=unclassified Microcoleus TaxID=2642155 RepID=UPI002FD2445B